MFAEIVKYGFDEERFAENYLINEENDIKDNIIKDGYLGLKLLSESCGQNH